MIRLVPDYKVMSSGTLKHETETKTLFLLSVVYGSSSKDAKNVSTYVKFLPRCTNMRISLRQDVHWRVSVLKDIPSYKMKSTKVPISLEVGNTKKKSFQAITEPFSFDCVNFLHSQLLKKQILATS